MISRLRDKLAGDGTCTALWSTMRDPQMVGLLARQPVDAIVLDAQHGFFDDESILAAIPPVVMAGKSPLVRLPVDRLDLCQKVLDHGALGVVAPMINCKADAEAFADAANFPPLGSRSFGPRYAASLYEAETNEYLQGADECIFAFAMVETRQSYDNLDDILSVDGLDGVLMGPSDFSISVRQNIVPDPYGPDTLPMVEDIANRTRAAGKIAAAFTHGREDREKVLSYGYRFVSLALDSQVVQAGAAELI